MSHSHVTMPQDPVMLMSWLNTKLRDQYPTLEDLCEDLHLDRHELVDKLAAAGFEYSAQYNKFW